MIFLKLRLQSLVICDSKSLRFGSLSLGEVFGIFSAFSKEMLRGPAAILFTSSDTCSDSIAKLFPACFHGESHNYRAISCKMGWGGLSHHFGGVLTPFKKHRAIWAIAAIPLTQNYFEIISLRSFLFFYFVRNFCGFLQPRNLRERRIFFKELRVKVVIFQK